MAMSVDSRHPAPFNNMGYNNLRYPISQYSNPWDMSAASQSHLYAASLPTSMSGGDMKPYATHAPAMSSAYTSQFPLPVLPTDMSARRPYGMSDVTSASSNGSTYAPTSAPCQTPFGYEVDRRTSHPFTATSDAERQSFNDALDASRGMVAMSQSDITPRNIYGTASATRHSAAAESYGFPSTHSPHSSISSASAYPTYYNSSVSEASYGDYSSASESVDSYGSRTLPRPNLALEESLPPAPQSMMGQFSSKVSSSSQKKHKCKICDKRFTRPSSLQTHMYSHTGEKPFACEVDGCGRNFSVVSNLRRHRKVHRMGGEGDDHDHPSPEDDD